MNSPLNGSFPKNRPGPASQVYSARTKIGVILLLFLLVSFLYLTLYPLSGAPTIALILLPVSLSAIYFGGLAGILAALAASGVSLMLLWLTEGPLSESIFLSTPGSDTILLLLAGVTLGWISDLRRHTRRKSEDRQRAESIMRASEEKLSSILGGMNEVVYSVTVPGLRLININPAAERLFGRPLSEITQNPRLMAEAVYPDDRPLIENSLSEVLEKKECEWVYRIFQPNGEVRWVLDRSKLITLKNNLPVRIDHLVSDITARKLAEEELIKTKKELELRVLERTAELQAANKQLQIQLTERIKAEEGAQQKAAEAEEGKRILDAVLEFIPEGIAIADGQDLVIRAISKHGLEMLGQPAEQLEGISMAASPDFWPLYHTDGRTAALMEETPLYRAAIDGEVILNEEWLVKTIEQNFVYILCNAGPIRDELGVSAGAVIAWRDISDRKKVAEEVQEQSVKIEAQHYLLQGRELERQRTARTLHDNLLQNMITISYAFTEASRMAREKNLKDTLNAIRTTLQDQIDNLRSFCGEVRPPILVHFGVEKGIRSHVEKLQDSAPALKVHLNLGKDGQLLPEDVRLTLFRIYMELMNNVVKHANATAVYVRFSMHQECAELEIADNGTGFEVPDSWIDLVRHGHLGLMGIRERIEAFSGQMNIRSSSAGTIVNVNLPIANHLN